MNRPLPEIDVKSLEQILECAVVSSWKQLSARNIPEQVHVAYETGADGRLDHLKLWSSHKHGEWDLICDYWLVESTLNPAGIAFCRGFTSDALEFWLDWIMSHQEMFSPVMRPPFGLIQVQRPTAEGLHRAERRMSNPVGC